MDVKKVNEITLTLVDIANTSNAEDVLELFADDDVQRVEIENGIVRVTFKNLQDAIEDGNDILVVTDSFVIASIDSPGEPASFVIRYADLQDLEEQLNRFAWLGDLKEKIVELAEKKLAKELANIFEVK